jgi:hypothetical protein
MKERFADAQPVGRPEYVKLYPPGAPSDAEAVRLKDCPRSMAVADSIRVTLGSDQTEYTEVTFPLERPSESVNPTLTEKLPVAFGVQSSRFDRLGAHPRVAGAIHEKV